MSIAAISTALGGMQAATLRLEDAAGRIARVSSVNEQPSASTPRALRETGSSQLGSPLAFPASINSDDLLSGLIDAKLAEISFKASLNVVKVANEMLGTLLDVTS